MGNESDDEIGRLWAMVRALEFALGFDPADVRVRANAWGLAFEGADPFGEFSSAELDAVDGALRGAARGACAQGPAAVARLLGSSPGDYVKRAAFEAGVAPASARSIVQWLRGKSWGAWGLPGLGDEGGAR